MEIRSCASSGARRVARGPHTVGSSLACALRHRARRALPGGLLLACALLAAVILAPAASAELALPSGGVRYARIAHACPPPQPGSATCFALGRIPVSSEDAGQAGVKPYTVNDGASKSGPAGGLTPSELASAYGYEHATGGSGQTVAIVDAFDDPNIESDLAEFDTEYGLPACTTANGCFEKVGQTGETTSLPAPDESGWSIEISLDVETVHSVCPGCKILLVEADNALLTNLAAAVDEAVALGATEVSNSYGGPESEGSGTEAAYDHPGVVIAASAGDDGYDDWTYLNEGHIPPARPNIPASLPTVVAVGGTTLHLTESGTRSSEKVWNGTGPLDRAPYEGATGGGCSTIFTAEPWQQDVSNFAATGCGSKRLVSDVSAVADPLTGFDIYDTYNCGEECEEFKRGKDWVTVGGTSLSAPLITSLYALAGGSDGVEYPSLTLYGHLGDASALYDVTEGGDGYCDAAPEPECGHPNAKGALVKGRALHVDCEYTTACDAAPGFDGPSGVGTPNGLGLFKPALPKAAITPPSSPKAGVAAAFSGAESSDPYPGGSIASYSWSWGDGTPNDSGVSPDHTYAAPGEYTVTLTVTDSYGFTSAPVTQVVTVPTLEEEEQKKAEEEAKQKAAEEAKRKAEEAKTTAEEEANKKIAERQHEIALEQQHEEEAKKKQEEEAAAKAASSSGSQGVSGFQASLTSPPPAPVPDAQLAGTTIQVSASGAVTLKISCPAGETSCIGAVTLRTLGAVTAAAGEHTGGKPAVLTLASGSFEVAGGKLAAVTLHLTSKARALLLHSHTLRVRATLVAHDPLGASHTTRTLVTLRAPKPARHRA